MIVINSQEVYGLLWFHLHDTKLESYNKKIREATCELGGEVPMLVSDKIKKGVCGWGIVV